MPNQQCVVLVVNRCKSDRVIGEYLVYFCPLLCCLKTQPHSLITAVLAWDAAQPFTLPRPIPKHITGGNVHSSLLPTTPTQGSLLPRSRCISTSRGGPEESQVSARGWGVNAAVQPVTSNTMTPIAKGNLLTRFGFAELLRNYKPKMVHILVSMRVNKNSLRLFFFLEL